MYNVKFIKYPSGWQVRLYNTLVGVNTTPDPYLKTDDLYLVPVPLYDEEIQDYVYQECDPMEVWMNPFSMKQEKAPTEVKERTKFEIERSKKVSMARTVNRVYHLARSNLWDWFLTLTFDPGKVDSMDYEATVKKLSKWLNNMKTSCPGLEYIIVPEKHESGRYHFHGLFRCCDGLKFSDSGHLTESGEVIYNVGSYRFGWSTATRICDQARCTKYISKYITKDLCAVSFGKKRYWCSRGLSEAETQEVQLDAEKMALLKSRLENSAVYIKQVDSGDIVTTYYELGEVVDDEGIC